MAFWVSFGKKLIEKIILEQMERSGANAPPRAVCINCGQRKSLQDLRDGVCPACRAQENRSEHHRSDEGKAGSRTQRNDIEEAYRILQCSKTDSDEHIKRQYRLLVKQCHIDSLPKGLPDYLVKAANQRFHEIQTAYETVTKSRN
jgi:DnaJ-domain-containing protein 1